MAEIVDLQENEGELSQFDDIGQDSSEKVETQPEKSAEDEIPEKYRGKSVKDYIKMHQEAEKLLGRQAQEVGELRKLTDQILKQQVTKAEQAQPQAQEIDFFDDPKEAVKRIVESHPDVRAARASAQDMLKTKTALLLKEKHPDFKDIVANPDFAEWVKASQVRSHMYAEADGAFNYDAADELLSNWKERTELKAKKAQEEVSEIKQKSASSLKAVSNSMGSGTGESSKKIYRRADLIRLKIEKPQRYAEMSDEITLAYQEGRVR